jgi:hypothetical protein
MVRRVVGANEARRAAKNRDHSCATGAIYLSQPLYGRHVCQKKARARKGDAGE